MFDIEMPDEMMSHSTQPGAGLCVSSERVQESSEVLENLRLVNYPANVASSFLEWLTSVFGRSC